MFRKHEILYFADSKFNGFLQNEEYYQVKMYMLLGLKLLGN